MRVPFFGKRAGSAWAGPACYTDDYTAVARPGFYALTDDGKRLRTPKVRLVWVDDAPGNPADGKGHYEVAGRLDGPTKPGRTVTLEVDAVGRAEVK